MDCENCLWFSGQDRQDWHFRLPTWWWSRVVHAQWNVTRSSWSGLNSFNNLRLMTKLWHGCGCFWCRWCFQAHQVDRRASRWCLVAKFFFAFKVYIPGWLLCLALLSKGGVLWSFFTETLRMMMTRIRMRSPHQSFKTFACNSKTSVQCCV